MDIKSKLNLYKELIQKIFIDGLFLIIWALIVKAIHEWLLPFIALHGIPAKIIDTFALIFDIGVSLTIIAIIAVDLYDDISAIWRGRKK